MTNNKSSYLYIGFSIIVWSVFPLLLGRGVSVIDPLFYVFLIQIFAGLSSALFAYFMITDIKAFKARCIAFFKTASQEFYVLVGLCGIASLVYNISFAYSVVYAPKMAASIILEMWPIHAAYMSYLFIKKDWQKIDWRDIVLAGLSICGVFAVFIGSAMKNFSNFEINFEVALGCFLALLGALTIALSTIIRARLGQEIEPIIHDDDKEKKLIIAVFVGEVVARIATIPFVMIAMFIADVSYDLTLSGLLYSAVIGMIIYNLGTAAYSMATLKAKSPNIHFSWFIMCVLSVLWLQLAGEDMITTPVFIGMVLVVCANSLLTYKQIKSPNV